MNGIAISDNNLEKGRLRLPDGRRLGYAHYGQPDGFPVLAIHGTPGSRKMLQPTHELALKKGILLIAPDRPGYGLSSPRKDYTPAQWVADVKLLLQALKIDRFGVFGVSGGGPFACAVAQSLRHRVQTLVLVSPVGLFDEQVRKNWSGRNAFFFNLLPRYPFLLKLAFHITRLFVLYAPSLPLKLFIRSLGKPDQLVLAKQVHRDQLLTAFKEGLRPGISGVLDDLRIFSGSWLLPGEKTAMPVTIWHGMEDLLVPLAGTLRLSGSFRDADVIVLEKAGHFWVFEHIEEILDKLLAGITP